MGSLLQRLVWRVRHLLVRGSVVTHNDAGRMQTVQVHLHKDELLDGVEVFLPHGFSMRVPPEPADGQGAETLVLAIGTDHRVALPPSDRRYRPRGPALRIRDVALYTDLDRPDTSFWNAGTPGAPTHRLHLGRDADGKPMLWRRVARGADAALETVSQASDTRTVTDGASTSSIAMTPEGIVLSVTGPGGTSSIALTADTIANLTKHIVDTASGDYRITTPDYAADQG